MNDRAQQSRGLLLVIALMSGACGGEPSATPPTDPSPAASAPATPAAAPAPAAPTGREVTLDPLPLRVRVASDSMGAMDMSMDDEHQSVTVHMGGETSLNIHREPRTLEQVKREIAEDTFLFPFRGWEREEGATGVYRFEAAGGEIRYQGFTRLEIGGASYVCKTTGLGGLLSVEEVNRALAGCGDVQARN